MLSISLVGLLGLGCSGSHDGVEKRLAGLRDDIARLQTDNDRLTERVDALESRQSRPPAPSSTAPTEKPNARAPLKVVKLFPGEAPAPGVDDPAAPQEVAADERPDAPGTRPVIRVRGKGDDEVRTRSRRSSASSEESP